MQRYLLLFSFSFLIILNVIFAVLIATQHYSDIFRAQPIIIRRSLSQAIKPGTWQTTEDIMGGLCFTLLYIYDY